MNESNAFNKFKESTSEFLNWASSGPLVQSTANFLSHPVKTIKNVGQDVKAAFTGKDSRQASFSAIDDNGDIYEYSLPSSGYVYKTPSGNHVSHRGYAYLTAGEDGRLKLNVSKSVAESDWFKTQFTENDTFKNVVKMFNANPGSNTTLTTTDKDGNTKNVTLAEAIKQYNDALGEYADNYEGISALRDFYSNNTGLTLTDDQIRISENTINKKDDANSDSKVIYIPDSWNAIYDFKKLPSWDDKTKTVSAKDFFDVYNLDEDGSITEEQWQALGDAAEATLENAFSGSTASNLNTEDPDAVKEAGDRLAKSIAAAKTLNGSRPDISTLHATAIFTKSVGEQFVSSLSKTYGNIGNFLSSGGEWLASSPVAPISWVGERAEDVVALANIPGNAMLVAMGAIGEDIANGRLNPNDATDYIAEVRESVGKLWSATHGDIDFRDYELATLGGRSMNEITETFDADIDYMTKISKAAAGGKFVGNLLELAVEVWVTEATGTAVGKRLFTTGENVGRAFGLAFKGSKIKDQTSILTKLYVGANKATSTAGNMMIQGFIDTIESDAGSIAAKLLSSDEVSEQEKQELYDAMAANTMFNVGSEIVISGMVPRFLETKPGRFVQTRAQKAIAGASLPFKKGQIALAKLINGVTQGKQLSEAAKEALTDELVKFGVNDLNSYNVKVAEANYNATKRIATAKKGEEYLNAITGETLTATSTTKAIETAVSNKIYLQNMIDRVTKGTKAEMEEIIKSPDVFKANVENRKAATNVIEAESKAGKKMSEINGVATFAQDDSNYLAYKKNLDRMDRKEAILKAQKKELFPVDKEFQTALRKLVSGFETTNDPRLVAALKKYYESNMALNKALTDWEVKNGLMSKEVFESLKATGYFGADDEFYMHTIVVKAKGNNFTEQYRNAISDYTKEYNKRARESYRVDPTNQTDKHISKKIDPDTRYLDPQLTNYARISAMAQKYQAKNWGKALMGIDAPLKPMDTLDRPTKISEVDSAIKEAEKASATAIEKLQVDELQPIIKGVDQASLGEAYRDQYKIEERITGMEESEAKQLGIFDNKQISDNVSKLGDLQVANNMNAIEGAPTYTPVKTYEEVESFLDEMPTKEMRAKAEKLMNTQVSDYDKAYKERVKKFEAQKKERLAQATTLEKEAKSIDSEIAKIEKANASGQAKYEKAKAKAEKDAKKAAESRAKYEESLAKDNEFYNGITDKRGKKMYNDLYNDLNDASIDQFQFDVKDAQELDIKDAISAVPEARSEEVRNVFKNGTNKKKFINRRRELANLVDNGEITKIEARKKLIDEYVDPDYLNSARVKAFGKNDTVAASAQAKAVEKGPVVDLHDYRSDVEFEPIGGYAVRRGYYDFVKDHTVSTLKENDAYDKTAWLATEQIVSPATRTTNKLNASIRNSGLSIGLDGAAPDIAVKEILDDNIDVSSIVGNYYGRDIDDLTGEIDLDSNDYINLAKELGGKNIKNAYDAERIIRAKAEEGVLDMLKNGNSKLTDDTIMYRVVSSEGNKVNKGDLSWLSKKRGDFSDDGFMFVTFDESEVLNNKNLRGGGDRYVLRIHAPEGTKLFTQQGDHYLVADGVLPMRFSYSGAGSGGELILTPGQKGKFVKSGDKIGDAEYVDVYLKGWNRPEEIKPFVPMDTSDKVAEAAAKREEAAQIRGEVDALKAPRSLSDKQKSIKAWNDAVKDTKLVDEMNRMWLQNAITSESIEVPEEVLANIKTQIAYAKLAENTQTELINDRVLASKDPKAMAKRIENWAKRYSNRRLEIDRLTEIAKMMKEGKAPFTQISNSILDDVISNTSEILSENTIGKRVFEMAKEKGVDPDLVKEYMSVNALLKENGNGDLVLRNDVLTSTKERLQKEMFHQAGVEKNPTSGVQKEVIKQFQSTIEETAKSKWATAQRELIDAGGNDFVDIEKNFNYVKKEMEKFVGEFNSANVIPMIDAEGELKYYEVSPLVADLYMNRPIARYNKASEWFNKISRISRVSKTNLNATSVVNQCFRDPLNAYIGAGFYKGFKAYENEMANRFGAELVSQLQESMSKAGWDTFTEGGTIAGRELEKKAAKYAVEDTGVNTFVSESTENALFDQQRTALRGVRSGALDNLDAWNKKYKKAKKGLFTWANEHTPGYMINEARETFLRRSDYAAAFNSALRQGKTVMEARNVAEFVSRQATTNFGRTFMWGNSIVNAVPFLGAAINGPASFFRLVAMDPVGVMSRFTTAGLAMMSIVAQSMTTKRDRDIYKTIPEYIKQENLAFVYDGEVFKIPIPQEMGALLAPFRQAVEKSNTGVQNHGWMEILANDLLEVSPIDLAGFETLDEVNLDGDPTIYDRMSREFSALVSQLAPPLVKTAYMAYTGVDPYTGNPIDNSYKWVDADGNLQTMDNTQSSFANWISDTLGKAGISKSPSFWNKTLDAAFGTGMIGIADWITGIFSGNIVGASSTLLNTQVEKSVNAINVAPYQLQDPYLREFKATINELEDEKNKLLSPDGDLALLSQKLSSLKETDKNYETQKKALTQEYMQKTEDYRQKVMNAVNNYSNHYGSTYTVNQFASVLNLLTFQESTLMPMNAYQDEQLSQMYYSAREQAYQTMIDMGFDSPNDWSIFGVARRNNNTGEIYVKYSSPTAILNMNSVAMGAGKVYSAELESVLKNAGLTKEARYKGYSEASAKGKNAAKEFKKEWNAAVASAIADTMYKYGPENVINSGDATELLNEYFYISNTSYKVKNYLEDVFGKED